MDEVVKPLQFIEENHNELYLKAKDFMEQNGIGENDIKRIVTRSGNEEDYGLFTYKNGELEMLGFSPENLALFAGRVLIDSIEQRQNQFDSLHNEFHNDRISAVEGRIKGIKDLLKRNTCSRDVIEVKICELQEAMTSLSNEIKQLIDELKSAKKNFLQYHMFGTAERLANKELTIRADFFAYLRAVQMHCYALVKIDCLDEAKKQAADYSDEIKNLFTVRVRCLLADWNAEEQKNHIENSFWFEPLDKYIKDIEEIKGIAEDNRNCIEVWRD